MILVASLVTLHRAEQYLPGNLLGDRFERGSDWDGGSQRRREKGKRAVRLGDGAHDILHRRGRVENFGAGGEEVLQVQAS